MLHCFCLTYNTIKYDTAKGNVDILINYILSLSETGRIF